MTTPTSFLKQAPLLLDLKAQSFSDAVGELVAAVAGNVAMADSKQFLQAVLTREQECSTALDPGISFPHARTESVRDILLAVGRSRAGAAHPAGPCVHLVFLIGTPKSKIQEYLMVLGFLARVMKRPQVFEQLMKAESESEFLVPFGIPPG